MIAYAATAAEHGSEPFYLEAEFWVAVAFVLFVALVFNKARVAITTALDKRAADIRARLAEAESLRREAEANLAEFRRRQADALTQAEDIVREAREEAERLGRQGQADLDAQLRRRQEQAIQKIAQAEADAVRAVRNLAVDVAITATRKVIEQELAGPRADALVGQAIAELPTRLH